MTKAELISAVADKAALQKIDAKTAIEAVFSSITDALKSGDSVTLVGFGTFKAVKREARNGVNPSNNKPIIISARTAVTFSPTGALKDAVNNR